MRIIVTGPSEEIGVYQTWIRQDLEAEVVACADVGQLEGILRRGPWDAILVACTNGETVPHRVLQAAQKGGAHLPVVMIAKDDRQHAIEAFRLGANDYIKAPVERGELAARLGRLARNGKDSATNGGSTAAGTEASPERALPNEVLFGDSSKMMALKQVVDKVLDADLPVLLTGESGTGKEMIARYIWSHSARKGQFVKVNCAAIPSELLESELFGFERGAFTGAFRRKPGKFEVASGGFLFLDEISELSYPLQSKLLHVLQDSSFSALGSTREVTVDVRVIAATNQALEDLVRRGGFRDDLFFRLNVVRLHIPPLRERLDQMVGLIDYFSRRFAAQYNARPMTLTAEMKSFLYSYTWPGNIRELENVIRRATVLGDGQFLAYGQTALGDGKDGGGGPERSPHAARAAHGPDAGRPQAQSAAHGEPMSLKEIARQASLTAEREAIEDVLKRTRWNRKKTAQILGVSYKTLLTKIKETGLDEK